MYSPLAYVKRLCTGTRRDGQACRAFAIWGDELGRCTSHAGRHHRGPLPAPEARRWGTQRAAYPPCSCIAYAWPHRPGGGLCAWPEPVPDFRRTTPAGTHRSPRYRPRARRPPRASKRGVGR